VLRDLKRRPRPTQGCRADDDDDDYDDKDKSYIPSGSSFVIIAIK
jgi:hypothetical protein